MGENLIGDRVAGFKAEYKKKLNKISNRMLNEKFDNLTESQQKIIQSEYKKKHPNYVVQPENVDDDSKLQELIKKIPIKPSKKRKDFNIQSILKRLVDVKAECKICHKTAHQAKLNLHHKDGDSSNNDWTNMVIYCDGHHNDVEGTIPRHRDEP